MKKFIFIRKHILLVSNLIIILFIIAGFTCVVYRDTRAYQALAEKHLKNTVSLADLNISKFIENTMSKPVMVSKTMANDEFLKSWILKETEHQEDDLYLKQLYNYLKTYQQKYGYSTVFCVSALTNRYYYQDGMNKTISETNAHDVWYYNFINSGQEYDLEVDTNEANNNYITVFVNFRVENDDGQLLGVIGVGLQVTFLEELIRSYEDDYDLSVYIINSSNVKTSFAGSTDIFVDKNELEKQLGITDAINLNKSEESQMQWFTVGGELKCLIIKYDNTLSWFLVIEKDTASISNAFQERIKNNIFFMLVSLAACILVTTIVFINYNQLVIANENKDELTGLSNRKLFSKQYSAFIRKYKDQPMTLFMFDIDHFKKVNDTYGHMFGNAILKMVGESLSHIIDGNGITARWGGDEFIGILALDPEETKKWLKQLMSQLKKEEKDQRYHITISTGIVKVNSNLTIDQISKKADAAMYCSKKNGRNKITVCEDE